MSTQDPWSVEWSRSSHRTDIGEQHVEVVLVPSGWRKSSYSTDTGHQCVEVAPMVQISAAEWKKSSRSTDTGGACVEVADLAAAVAVRDSKDPDGPKLVFGPAAWQAFAAEAKSGALDLS
ncbi:DUF397 domain-containing protein [Actinomadura decatromicini]|uniref:DUF397 domain-containing protein n=1 Tax=Actinomadura decatromicini TaxID=2604572 RepID=A0A5D3F9F7_9ACTN|nr:DUF397 domain-containing protein [Actinomadura decatromicini]